jgi:hypothetical protein
MEGEVICLDSDEEEIQEKVGFNWKIHFGGFFITFVIVFNFRWRKM